METITFIGKSRDIFVGIFKSLVVTKHSLQSDPIQIHFLNRNGNISVKIIELNSMYSLSDFHFLYFESSGKCSLSYELL